MERAVGIVEWRVVQAEWTAITYKDLELGVFSKCCRSNKGSLCEVGKERGRRIAGKKWSKMKKKNSWNIIKVLAIISIPCYCYQYVKMEYGEGKELEYDQMKRVIIGLWILLSYICYCISKTMLKVHLLLFTHFWLCWVFVAARAFLCLWWAGATL